MLPTNGGELAEQLHLTVGQVLRSRYLDVDMQVATTPASQVGDA